jgi:hypothetical protein
MLSRVPWTLKKEGNDRNDMETLQLEGTDSTNVYQQLVFEVLDKSEGSLTPHWTQSNSENKLTDEKALTALRVENRPV